MIIMLMNCYYQLLQKNNNLEILTPIATEALICASFTSQKR